MVGRFKLIIAMASRQWRRLRRRLDLSKKCQRRHPYPVRSRLPPPAVSASNGLRAPASAPLPSHDLYIYTFVLVDHGEQARIPRITYSCRDRSHINMARPRALSPASRGITHLLILLLAFTGSIYLSSAYPDYYTQMYASSASSCLSHPLTRYKNHGAPSPDS